MEIIGTTRHASLRAVLGAALALGTLAACGSDAARTPSAAPAIGATTSSAAPSDGTFDGDFDSLPRPDGAESVGARSQERDVTTQSFEAKGSTPEKLLDFFRDALARDGWEVDEPVDEVGTAAILGVWTSGAWTLRVSAVAAPNLDGAQYSLELTGPTSD